MLLNSQRLIYTKFTQDHLAAYIGLVTQEQVMKYITGFALNREQANERFQVALDANRGIADLGFMAITEKGAGGFIGLGKIVPFENGMTEIGYALLPEFWGKGYASEITKRLVDYAKELGNIEELIGLVDPVNEPSIRVLTKHGFVFYREILNSKSLPRADYILKL